MKLTVRTAVWILTALWGLAACGAPPPEAVPTATPVLLTVDITPSTRPVVPAINQCAAELGDVEILLEERFPEFFEADLRIRLGEPDQTIGFAAQVAREELALVLNEQNPITSLTQAEIQALFSGQTNNWSQLDGDDAPVAVWVPYDGDETRAAFDQFVMEELPVVSNARLAPDPDAIQQAVGSNPYAVGFLPQANLIDTELNPVLLGVRLPVLVLAEAELEGAAAQLVACLQSGSGQETLKEIYP